MIRQCQAQRVLNTRDLINNGIFEIGDGYRAKNSEMGPIGLPFARAANVNHGFHFDNADILNQQSVAKAGPKTSRSGDIVFTSKGTVGRFGWVTPHTPRFVYSPQLCYWRVRDTSAIDPRYLLFWMHGREFLNQVHQVKSLTDMADYVSLGDQRRMRITLPPLLLLRYVLFHANGLRAQKTRASDRVFIAQDGACWPLAQGR